MGLPVTSRETAATALTGRALYDGMIAGSRVCSTSTGPLTRPSRAKHAHIMPRPPSGDRIPGLSRMVKCPHTGWLGRERGGSGWRHAGGRGHRCPPLSQAGIGHGHLAMAHHDSAASGARPAQHRRLGRVRRHVAEHRDPTRAATPRRRPVPAPAAVAMGGPLSPDHPTCVHRHRDPG